MRASQKDSLAHLAALLRERNRIERLVAETVGRPGERGHVGEFIASVVFDIELHESASAKASWPLPDRTAQRTLRQHHSERALTCVWSVRRGSLSLPRSQPGARCPRCRPRADAGGHAGT